MIKSKLTPSGVPGIAVPAPTFASVAAGIPVIKHPPVKCDESKLPMSVPRLDVKLSNGLDKAAPTSKESDKAVSDREPDKSPDKASDSKEPDKSPDKASDSKEPDKSPDKIISDSKEPDKSPDKASDLEDPNKVATDRVKDVLGLGVDHPAADPTPVDEAILKQKSQDIRDAICWVETLIKLKTSDDLSTIYGGPTIYKPGMFSYLMRKAYSDGKYRITEQIELSYSCLAAHIKSRAGEHDINILTAINMCESIQGLNILSDKYAAYPIAVSRITAVRAQISELVKWIEMNEPANVSSLVTAAHQLQLKD